MISWTNAGKKVCCGNHGNSCFLHVVIQLQIGYGYTDTDLISYCIEHSTRCVQGLFISVWRKEKKEIVNAVR